MTMVERMARAMFDDHAERTLGNLDYADIERADGITKDEMRESDWQDEKAEWMARARAAFPAMREPSEGMLAAVSRAEDELGYIAMSADESWPIMIDAAIQEAETA